MSLVLAASKRFLNSGDFTWFKSSKMFRGAVLPPPLAVDMRALILAKFLFTGIGAFLMILLF
jgi:hypothetical protein